jgi:hypothetical protein
MSVLENQALIRSCYLCAPWSATASSLVSIICERYNSTAVHVVLPEEDAHVPKHVAEAHLMFMLINNVHLVGITMLYGYITNAQKGQLKLHYLVSL